MPWTLVGKHYLKITNDAPVRTGGAGGTISAADKVAAGAACEVWLGGAWTAGKMLGNLPVVKYTLTLTATPGATTDSVQGAMDRAFKRELGTDGSALIEALWEVPATPAPATSGDTKPPK